MNSRLARGADPERGAIAGIEALPFGMLLFVAGTLFIANIWAVIDAKLAVTSAAREATRAFVEADDGASARVYATAATYETLAALGREDRERITIDVPVLDGPFGRCTRVTITIHYRTPALSIPWLGGLGRGIDSVATHSEVIDPDRRGLIESSCT